MTDTGTAHFLAILDNIELIRQARESVILVGTFRPAYCMEY